MKTAGILRKGMPPKVNGGVTQLVTMNWDGVGVGVG